MIGRGKPVGSARVSEQAIGRRATRALQSGDVPYVARKTSQSLMPPTCSANSRVALGNATLNCHMAPTQETQGSRVDMTCTEPLTVARASGDRTSTPSLDMR